MPEVTCRCPASGQWFKWGSLWYWRENGVERAMTAWPGYVCGRCLCRLNEHDVTPLVDLRALLTEEEWQMLRDVRDGKSFKAIAYYTALGKLLTALEDA